MTSEAALVDTARLAQMVFLAVFSVSFALVLRVAQDWYPFTPTYTAVERKWMGWPDVFRWALSGLFLFVIPFAYFTVMLVHVTKSSIHIPLEMPSYREAARVAVLFLLPLPLLGFYDIWQAIVRTWPSVLYSPQAKAIIENRVSSAFTAGKLGTLLLGVGWIVGPIVLFQLVLRL